MTAFIRTLARARGVVQFCGKELSSASQEVISFRRFIPYHAAFNKHDTYEDYKLPSGDLSAYDTDLGKDFIGILNHYLLAGKLDNAANLLRHVILRDLIKDPDTAVKLKQAFIEHLKNDPFFCDLSEYLDILVFISSPPESSKEGVTANRLLRKSINKIVSNLSGKRRLSIHDQLAILNEKLSAAKSNLAVCHNAASLDRKLHQSLNDVLSKRKMFDLVDFSNAPPKVSSDACNLMIELKKYSEAVDLVVKTGNVEKNVVYRLFKCHIERDGPVLSESKFNELESWMEDNGFGHVLKKKRLEAQNNEWNDLDK